ncbi:MAG: GGDEF domain-containing protein [Pirellulales bacterium]|nr:GGDEF domain-containing protein [Pirellulales bacterium]
MNSIWWYIGAVTIISGLQLILGIFIGLWIHRHDRRRTPSMSADAILAREYIKELAALTCNVTRDVNQHHSRINLIQNQLGYVKRAGNSSLTDLVVGVVSELMRANQELQSQLASAESELRRQTSEIESHLSKSMTDELTKLPNRRAFENTLDARIKSWQYQKVPFALMMMDIDHFKQVNDQYGHMAGDHVLCNVADTIKKTLRKPDLVTRFGGEEFAILLPYTSLDDASNAARKVLSAIAATVTRFESHALAVTVSVGLAAVMEGENATDLIKRADMALYASKSDGRNCGYLHDGDKCGRIFDIKQPSVEVQSARDGIPPDDAPELSPELMAICSELRDRASDVAKKVRVSAEASKTGRELPG